MACGTPIPQHLGTWRAGPVTVNLVEARSGVPERDERWEGQAGHSRDALPRKRLKETERLHVPELTLKRSYGAPLKEFGVI